MQIWKRRPQEQEGTYLFSGTFYVTPAVLSVLSEAEILTIYNEIQKLVKEKGGIDYFQVFENDTGYKLYFMDQCNPEMMENETYKKEYNYCTLMFSHEY